jgi:stearoyl-CoA desaturase (delta-9 desaturase)
MKRELFKEFLFRINLFRDKKNWVQAACWFYTLAFAIPLYIFLVYYFSWSLFFAGFVYSMIVLGTHGTIYYHRYSTHRAYQFTHPFWRFLVRNAVVKIIPEELYVVSHHVHHHKSEKPGDPYNVNGGWWYCFLADAIHQPIAKNLSPADYTRVSKMIDHTGVHINSYEQYRKWGSVCHPGYTFLHFTLNWAFWYGAFYLLGGHALATALFGASGFWAVGVRTFNFDGHGGGKDKRRDGIDFNRADLSINQVWPGVVTGEWHNNHHLYPSGARAGFLPYQFDPAWVCLVILKALGGVKNLKDYKQEFLVKYVYKGLNTSGTSLDLPVGGA